jgi:hypothetical protein
MRFEGTRSIEERKSCTCPHCEWGVGEQKITTVGFDMTSMGKDPAFPTAYAQWAKRHEKAGQPLRTTGKPRPK